MQRIINIEEIFYPPFSARSVIERKRDQREKRHPLIMLADCGEECKRYANDDELENLFRRGKDEHGCENAPNAVIHSVIRRWEKIGKHFDQKDRRDEGECKEKPCVDIVLFYSVIERVDQDHGKGKRNEYALIERAHRKEIDELADRAESEHLQEILRSVFRIFCALCNHKCENGECQSADEAEDIVLRK